MAKTRGRPKKTVAWPEGNFTPRQVIEHNESNVSAGLVHLNIKKALEGGDLQEVGKLKSSKGRPASLYSRRLDS